MLNRYITMDEFLMGRATLETLPPDLVANANVTVTKANDLLDRFGEYRGVHSGYRRPEDNAKVPNPKAHSCHLTCEAVDLADEDGKLKAWLKNNLHVLEELSLYQEDPASTPTWAHVQTRAPKSGHRVFIP